jgi:hypothetical protein
MIIAITATPLIPLLPVCKRVPPDNPVKEAIKKLVADESCIKNLENADRWQKAHHCHRIRNAMHKSQQSMAYSKNMKRSFQIVPQCP